MTILSYVSTEADLSVGYVYKWTNLVNGMMYIGKHCGSNPGYIGSGIRFRAAIKEYGIENFQREILYCGPNFTQIEKEILLMIGARQSPNFYNDYNVFSEGRLGKKNGDKQKAAVSAALKGKKLSEEQRAKYIGRVKSETHRANLSAACKGRPKSEIHKLKTSRGNHRRYHENNDLCKIGCGWCNGTLSIPD
jgi:hypothetical protein